VRQIEVNVDGLGVGGDLKKIADNLYIKVLTSNPQKIQIVELDKKDDTRSWFFIVRQIQWIKDKKKSCIQDEYMVVKAENRIKAIEGVNAYPIEGNPFDASIIMVISLPDLTNLCHYPLGTTIVQQGYMTLGTEKPQSKPKRRKHEN